MSVIRTVMVAGATLITGVIVERYVLSPNATMRALRKWGNGKDFNEDQAQAYRDVLRRVRAGKSYHRELEALGRIA